MKILRLFTVMMIAAMTFAACDDTTENIGGSITNNVDNINISNAVYDVATNSLVAGPVLNRSNSGLIGKVKDPETGTYVSGDYMSQFGVLPDFDIDTLQYIQNANGGKIEADSCYLLVSYKSTYGDTLAPMKVTAYEMTKAMPENSNYLSDFDAFADGFVSKDNYQASATYQLSDYVTNFKIYLNKPYTKDGKTYKNYGSYIMQTYYEHPEYFETSYRFIHNVCPGFYIKSVGGVGNVANIWNTELQFYWTRSKQIKASDGVTDSTAVGHGYHRFDGTEEVLQLNKINNDASKLAQLAADESCTYIKSPAGIFTEVTLPVEEIMRGHEKDTLNTATISFPRLNNTDNNNKYQFDVPSTILMVQKDSLNSFFEKNKITDNRTSYTASYSKTGSTVNNAFTFNNISNLISAMYKNKGTSDNWNKVVLVPVTVTTSTLNNATVITKINHDMALTSTRLQKGTKQNSPIKIKVIYSKFKEE